MVVQYRKMNEKTMTTRTPYSPSKISWITFTTLILASEIHEIEMAEKNFPKTAFNVGNWHYEFVRMAFGLENAPLTFQRVIDNVTTRKNIPNV